MANKKLFFAGVSTLCLILHITTVSAIYCFQCNSLYNPECENIQPNDTSSEHYKLCNPDEAVGREIFCRKLVQTIYDREGMVRVIRTCGWEMHKRDCYVVSNKGHQDVSCQCFQDGCNAANPSHSKPILFLLFPLIFLYLFI
ncbi:uncharacterized protein [Halyomorpha halys]|uniref:uncharacterized protein n=1 Tax=Halyomorpha halys TaxID=286706 RepID=UPI0006D4E353|nr:uncharacterized protein LOC106685073 [Halyomorpha halys]